MKRLPPLTAIPPEVAAVADYVPLARARLDDNAWAYLHSAAADEQTWRWNREAFDHTRLWPRVLRSMAGGHTRVSLFGRSHEAPILLGPVAWQTLFHPQGEIAVAQAAGALGGGMVLSTLAGQPLEAVAQALRQQGEAPLWFQLYWQADRDLNRTLIRRAEAAGYEALMLTVDAPIHGVRNGEQRAGFRRPPGVVSANLVPYPAPATPALAPGQHPLFDGWMAHAPTWGDVSWLVGETRLPVILKGLLHPDDGREAVQRGAAGVVVSNHGGRTLDTFPSALEALPAMVAAVGDRIPVLLDGGIRRGSDVFKALALGAKAVLVGRSYVYALAAAGALGVAHVIRLLQDELAATMALCGCPTVADIRAGCIGQRALK